MIPMWIPEYVGEWKEQKKILQFNKKFGGGQELYRSSENTMRLRSVQMAHITVDEGSQNPHRIIGEMNARIREPKVPDKSFGIVTNPGGIGTAWYRRDFIDPVTRIKPHYDEKFGQWTRGTFHIQCLPTENPLLGTDYYVRLNQQQPHVKDALLYGRWDTFEGLYYDRLNPLVHRIRPFRIPDNVIKWRGIDIGTLHPAVCLWVAFFPPSDEYPKGRLVLYRELSILEKIPSNFKRQILALENQAGDKNIMGTVLSPDAFRWKGTDITDRTVAEMFDSSSKDIAGDKSLMCQSALNDRIPGWRILGEYFDYAEEEATDAETGEKYQKITKFPTLQMFDTCRLTWMSITNLIHDKNNPEDVQKTDKSSYQPGFGDDESDALRYVVATLESGTKLMKEPDEFTPQAYGKKFNYSGAQNDYSPYARF